MTTAIRSCDCTRHINMHSLWYSRTTFRNNNNYTDPILMINHRGDASHAKRTRSTRYLFVTSDRVFFPNNPRSIYSHYRSTICLCFVNKIQPNALLLIFQACNIHKRMKVRCISSVLYFHRYFEERRLFFFSFTFFFIICK